MQATINSKQFNTGRMKNVAIALILGTTVLTGAVAVALQRDDSPAVTGTSQSSFVVAVPQTSDIRFIEDNILLPAAAAPSAHRTTADIRFFEDNVLLPTGAPPSAPLNTTEMRFIEDNLYLPAVAALVTGDRQLLEDNSWGADFSFDLALTDPHGQGVR